MAAAPHQLPVTEKLAYGVGDAGANFIFQTQITFLLFFYTDVLGISTTAAGLILIVSRVLDAVNDPVVGILADRTRTRWGRYRPWILATAVPLAAALVLCYTAPNFSAAGKIIWAAATYNLLMILYAANNVPYSALSGVMSDDSNERTSLAQWRFLGAMTAALIVNTLTPGLVEQFGRGDSARGFQLTMALWGTIAVLFFATTFFFTRERVDAPRQPPADFRQNLADLIRSGPWIALFLLAVLIYIQLALRGGTAYHYFAHFVRRQDSFLLLGRWPITPFGLFNGIGLAAVLVGVALAKPLSQRFGKRRTFQTCLLISALLMAAFALVPRDALAALFALQVLLQLAFGPTIPLLWTMMADVADYTEWTTGRRATALAFASIVFGGKLGLGIGAWISGTWLAFVGYDPTANHSAATLRGLAMLISLLPAAALLAGFFTLFFYRIDEPLEQEMRQSLRARREEP